MSKPEVKDAIAHSYTIEAIESLTGAESIAPDHMGRGSVPGTHQYVPAIPAGETDTLRQVQAFLYRQAALLDAKRWQEWTDLFAEDGIYWMPVTPEQTSWESEPSIFAEDRLLREIRMGRLQHPNAWSQSAMWGTNHLVSNVIVESEANGALQVYSRFQMMELRRDVVRHFGGIYRHTLVRTPAGLRIRMQRVDMMNGQAAPDYVIPAWV